MVERRTIIVIWLVNVKYPEVLANHILVVQL